MKTYEAVFNDKIKGVFGISLVENPAMEGEFIALSKQEIKLATIDEEKRELIGLVLEPNKPIYRNQNGEEFNMFFNEETIRQLSRHFFKEGNQHNSTIEHQNKIEGVTFVESWIVEDSKIDKSSLYGFSYPKGSWIATMKVDNDEVWNEYVKTGQVKGFSIDAMLELKEINNENQFKMTRTELKEFFVDLFGLTKEEEAPQEIKSEEVEQVEVKPEEVVEEIVEEAVETQPEEPNELEVLKEMLANFKTELAEVKTEFSKKEEEMKVELEAKEKEVEELKVQLSKEPEVEAIKAKPEVKEEREPIVQPRRDSIKTRAMEAINELR